MPAGWDRFSPFTTQAKYYDYKLLTGDHSKRYGSRPQDYSTRVIARRAGRFIRAARPPSSPTSPLRPSSAPRLGAGDPRLSRPSPVPTCPGRAAVQLQPGRQGGTGLVEAPPAGEPARRATDDASRLGDAALRGSTAAKSGQCTRAQGAAGRTIIVFASDNGYSFGSHRWIYKGCAYEECIHVPLMIRAPGVPTRTVRAMVGNQDIAPTLAALAGVEHPPVDGRSLVPLIRGRGSRARDAAPHQGHGPPLLGAADQALEIRQAHERRPRAVPALPRPG